MIRMDYQLTESELDERVQKRINGSVIYSERDQYGRVDVMLVWHEPIPGGRGKTAEIREHIGEIDYKDRTVTYFPLSGGTEEKKNTTTFDKWTWIHYHLASRPIDTRKLLELRNGIIALDYRWKITLDHPNSPGLEPIREIKKAPPIEYEDGSYKWVD